METTNLEVVNEAKGTPASRVLLGATYLTSIVRDEGSLAAVMFLNKNRFNMIHQDVGEFLFHHHKGRYSTESLEDQAEVERLAFDMVDRVRTLIQVKINTGLAYLEREHKEKFQNLVQVQKEAQRPHEMGTVAEIAAKYGISKSEVRRLKAQDALHTLKEKA